MASGSGRTKGQAAERDRRYFGKSRLESREGGRSCPPSVAL